MLLIVIWSQAILSGPAGGVVGYAQTTFGMETQQPVIYNLLNYLPSNSQIAIQKNSGVSFTCIHPSPGDLQISHENCQMQIIGFDMGGTSTDVSRYAGSYEQVLETQTAGIIIQVNFSGLCYCPLKYAVLTGCGSWV